MSKLIQNIEREGSEILIPQRLIEGLTAALTRLIEGVEFDSSTSKLKLKLDSAAELAAEIALATQSASGLMSFTDKTKLDGIEDGAQVNPTLGNIATINKNNSQSQYLRGDGSWATPPNDNTTYDLATTSANGLMSASDKSKLNGIDNNANNYSHPTTSGYKHIPAGGADNQILQWDSDGTAKWRHLFLQSLTFDKNSWLSPECGGNGNSYGVFNTYTYDEINLNEFRTNGAYAILQPINGPISSEFPVRLFIYGGNRVETKAAITPSETIVQICAGFNTSNSGTYGALPNMYFRTTYPGNSSWKAWQQLNNG